jgi:site-specific DNA recombinase
MNAFTPHLRVAIYARVSTTRQAEADLSIPDQIRQAETCCAQRCWEVIETFVEPGASGTDDRRPAFQRMIDAATGTARPFDVVLVHSMSRFFRDQFHSEMYIRKLKRARVEVVSVTQNFDDSTTGNLVRQILGNFDEYQSKENAKHTLRAMRENAMQGFWNGSVTPFGYQVIEVERRGTKAKKRLAPDEVEGALVRRIYAMALGRGGPAMGVKAIAAALNAEGVRFRGKRFHISNVYRILTCPTYAGTHHFNRRSARTGEFKPREEWVSVAVPALVNAEEFAQVQAQLAARSPKRIAPRLVGNPTLLTGIARCGICGSGLTLRTGKSGRYRYYACAGRAQKGATVCTGCTISMEALDGMVVEQLADHLFTPDRLVALLQAYVDRSTAAQSRRDEALSVARRRHTEAEGKLRRLLQLAEDGVMDLDDPTLRERFAAARQARDEASDAVRQFIDRPVGGPAVITPARIQRLAAVLRDCLRSGDMALRKAYLRMFLDQVVVGAEEIRLRGPTAALATAANSGELSLADMVPSFVRKWRPVGESNPCYRRERDVNLSIGV